MIYGYARCSTNEKMQDIDRQVRELKQQGATDTTIYLEYESGMKADRAELQKLLSVVQSCDTIIATEVSRITRSTKQLCDIIELAKNTGSVASEYIISQIEGLNGEIDDLKSKVSELESSSVDINSASLNLDIIVSNLKKINYEVDDASLDDKRLLLSTIVDSIVWDDASGNLSIVYMGAKMDDLVSLSDGSHFCSDGRSYIYE